MNLSIIKGLVSSAKSCAKTGVLLAKAHAPEILVCAGIGGFGVTIYQACRATNEAHDLIVRKEDAIEAVEERLDDMLKSKINYNEINSILLNLRNKSSKYILNQLDRGNK